MDSPLNILTDSNLEIPHISLDTSPNDGLFQQSSEVNEHALLAERRSITHEFKYLDKPVYVTVGLFEDGEPAELLVTAPHVDANESNLLDFFARSISLGLQNRVSLATFADEFAESTHPLIVQIFSWLLTRFETVKPSAMDTIRRPQSLSVEEE